ncbi:MAG: nucleotidyltransferase substrate binding protein [Sphingomonadales bacterium]
MNTPRWHLRFEGYRAALARLSDAMAKGSALSDLERAGAIQRFEGAWELAWKTMRDYLWATGIPVETPTPANVIRAAFQVDLIDDGDIWFRAMQDRNRTSHEYDEAAAARVFAAIDSFYLPMLVTLESRLGREAERGN